MGWFIIDSVSSFPFNAITSNGERFNYLLKYARLPRLYKLLKISKFSNFLYEILFLFIN